MTQHVFCRDLALERGEPIEGTGAIAEKMFLLAWPRGAWRTPRQASIGMSLKLGEAVRRARLTNPYLILVDRVGDSKNVPRVTVFPEAVSFEPENEDALISAIEAWSRGEELTGTPEERITILCCTDSRADACCAKFGFATYKALAAEADPDKFNILQSSHIGGCRFAASIVVASRRQRYARLDPVDVPDFLQALDAGDIYLPAFKGRADLPEPEQVAELAAMRWAAKAGLTQGAVALVERRETGENKLQFVAHVGTEKLAINVQARVFDLHGKCAGIQRDPPKATTRWLVRGVEPVAGSDLPA